ncbi:MAG TPA: hypothetical protein VGN72_18065, partial [Tepidisphaeraceae bacterium]|nr:hypothetical protein [Tepidisphaeraceae bacterium]
MTNALGRTGCTVETLESRQLLTNFVVSTVADSGVGSLRQAILDANSTPGADAIHFAIGDGGAATIRPLSALPDVGSAVTIDGTTQPGFAGKPLIEISGELITQSASGLRLFGGSVGTDATVVRGLAINRFRGIGVFINGVGMRVEGNYIGTNLAGDAAAGSAYGVFLWGTQHTIGGTVAAARNVISGNSTGIAFGTGSAEGIQIQGNYIGMNASGTDAVPNQVGISLSNGGVTIGAPDGYAQGGNLISGNVQSGIRILGGYYNLPVAILNNRIGPGVNGEPLGAGSAGVVVTNSGGTPSPVNITGNEIAFAGAGGIAVGPSDASTHVLARGNFLHSNQHPPTLRTLNIDLGAPGPDANDPYDADAGANDLLNAPVLTGFGGTLTSPTAVGTYHGLPSTSLVLDVYRVGSGWRGEPVGTASITTDASGNASFEIPLNVDRSDGGAIEATASLLDAAGGGGVTSESSAVLPMGGGAIQGVVQVSGVNTAGRVVYIDRNNNSVLDEDERRVTTNGDGFRLDGLPSGSYRLRQVVPAGEVQAQPFYSTNQWQAAYEIQINGTHVVNVTFATTLGPVVGGLMPSQFAVSPGQTVSLRASATPGASGSAVSAVRFYKESNGTLGLQLGAGGDGFISQQTTPASSSSNVYETQVPHSALTGGINTFYVQATDALDAVSNVTQKEVLYRDELTMISGVVFVDTNGNGNRDAGEDTKVNGAVVYIDRNYNDRFDAGDLQSGTSAWTDGSYTFASLPAGTHRIGLFRPTGDYVQTSPAAFGLLTVTVAPGQVLTGADFMVKSQPLALVATPASGTLAVPEGATAQFSLSLNRRPWWNVAVSAATFPGSDPDLQLEASLPITFTPDNWNVPQTVAIRAAQDADLTSDSATFRFSSTEIAVPLEITATEIDDDPAAPVVLQAEDATLGGGTAKSSQHAGYTGSGYADFAGSGSSAQWTVTRTAA